MKMTVYGRNRSANPTACCQLGVWQKPVSSRVHTSHANLRE